MPEHITRRHLIGATGALGVANLIPATGRADDPAASKHAALSVPANGHEYERVPLRTDMITVAAVQTRINAVDGQNPATGMKRNLELMAGFIDKAQYYSGKKDLLCFHEFPITGWDMWDRKEVERLCIEIPGPETEAISAKAREHQCYIKFGAYVRDPDWPGHILSVTTLIGPDGAIVAKDWKARNVKGVFPTFELFTTTVYNVLDQYVEMYGEEAVIPVHLTDIGNICTSSTQLEPELIRAMALKGAELILRTASGGFQPFDMQATSAYNKVYTVIVNNAASLDNPNFFPDAFGRSGGSAIYGPNGEILAQAKSKFEQGVTARIPIASYRKRHRIPDVHMDLYQPILDAYQPRYAPNLFSEYTPTDLLDAKRYLDTKNRWR